MPQILVDLFSDTLTRPSPAMRQAMVEAEVGDEQKFEDPTTNRLQEMVAGLLGQETAVFLPSGTMCNEIAFAVHCGAGDEIILDQTAHPLTSEAGGPAVISHARAAEPCKPTTDDRPTSPVSMTVRLTATRDSHSAVPAGEARVRRVGMHPSKTTAVRNVHITGRSRRRVRSGTRGLTNPSRWVNGNSWSMVVRSRNTITVG